jgi:hypothetical protein
MHTERFQWIEEKRSVGNHAQALAEARRNGSIEVREIAHLPKDDLENKMRIWRQWTTLLSSIYKDELNGKSGVQMLYESRDVIRNYYYNEHVWQAALDMEYDNPEKTREYQMAAEMCRDEGKFWLNVSQVQPHIFVDRAVTAFDEALTLSKKGTSAHALAYMEKAVIQRHQGKKIEFEKFSRSYYTVMDLAPKAGGDDRAAAVSWMYTREALLAGRSQDVTLGFTNLKEACGDQKSWLNYPLREVTTAVFGQTKRFSAPLLSPSEFPVFELSK